MSIQVLMDVAQTRVTQPLLVSSVDGRTWDVSSSVSGSTIGGNTIIDPITLSLLLRPQVLQAGWYAGASGSYARVALSGYERVDYSAVPTTDWSANNLRFQGDVYLESLGVNYAMYQAGITANRAMHLSIWVPQGAKLTDIAVDMGWGEVGASTTVGLRVFAGGQVNVYKGGVQVGSYKISGDSEPIRTQSAGQGAPTGSLTGKLIDLYMFPCRRRSLVVFSSAGSGFEHVFTDLDPTIINTITPAGRFWWQVPVGKASVQCVPMLFPTSGFAVGVADNLLFAPPAGASFTFIGAADVAAGQSVTPSLVGTDGVTAYTSATFGTQAVIRVNLGGDGTGSPTVYAFDAVLAPVTAMTNATQQTDITGSVKHIRFSVGESASDVKFTLTLMDDADLTIAGAATQSNRPVQILVDGKPFLYGVTMAPELEEKQTDVAGCYKPLVIPCEDPWNQQAKSLYQKDCFAFDGLQLSPYTMQLLLAHSGVPTAQCDLGTNTFELDYTPGVSTGNWSYKPKAGEYVAEWLKKMHDTFGGTWFMGWYPTATGPKFRFRSEADLGLTPGVNIYLHRGGDPTKIAVRKYKEKILPPEATRVTVYGFDPASLTSIHDAYVNVSGVEDPTLAPSARPTGWLGQVEPVFLEDVRFTTPAGVTAAKQSLVDRLSVPLSIAEWRSTLLQDSTGVALWTGNVVAIYPTKGIYRILSFSGEFRHEGSSDDGTTSWMYRDISYVAKNVGPIPPA